MTSISSISSSTISVLFTPGSPQTAASASTATQAQTPIVSGKTDDALKTGGAIGKIIEIVAGMSQSDKVFDMNNAQRTYAANGDYSETTTGTGTVVTDEEIEQNGLKSAIDAASGTGPQADRAKAFLAASASGSITKTDMATLGVSSTLTEKNSYYADGSQKGESGSYNTKGIDQFLAKYVTITDGVMRDKAGNYASISQNGTQFTFFTWPPGATTQSSVAHSASASV